MSRCPRGIHPRHRRAIRVRSSRSLHGQIHGETTAAARLAADFNHPAMSLHQTVADRETEAGAATLGGEEGFEQMRASGGVHSGTAVFDVHLHSSVLGKTVRLECASVG